MFITKNCVCCKSPVIIPVDPTGYARWQGGDLIQDALPELSAASREMLISSICEPCFDRMFAESDEPSDLATDLD